jgi:hypothetical protein
MAEVEIERLALEVPGLGPAQGRRLAELIAQRLSQARWTPAHGTDRIEVAVSAAGASLDEIAKMIVDEMRRRMT